MDYMQLTDAQLADVRRQKLLEIEAEHARLALDLDLASVVGMENEQVALAKTNLMALERQHQTLRELLAPPSADPSDNGAVSAAPVPAAASN